MLRSPNEGQDELLFMEADIKQMVQSKVNDDLPVIIDCLIAQRLLNNMGLEPDFSIHIMKDYHYDDWLSPILEEYEIEFNPKTKSDLAISLSFE